MRQLRLAPFHCLTFLSLLFARESVAGFEVVDWANLLLDQDRVADSGDDGLWVLVGHGAFVQRVLADRACIDALHALFEGGEGEAALGLTAAEQASGAVWRALLPVVLLRWFRRLNLES